MNITDLRYITEVGRTNSISKAANNLFISQPNLSKVIHNIENEVGFSIFVRSSQGVTPTKEGLDFLQYASSLLSQFDEFQSMFSYQNKKIIKFNLSMPRATYISVALANFTNSIPDDYDIGFDIRETNSLQTINNVATNQSDLGIIRYPINNEQYFFNLLNTAHLKYEILYEYKMLVLMNKEHPLANMEYLSYFDLLKYTELVHGDIQLPSISYNKINPGYSHQGPQKRIIVYERGSQFEFLSRVSTTYMWVSPLPHDVLERYGLIQKECPINDCINKDVLIYQEKHRKTDFEENFIKHLKSVYKNLNKS